MAAFSVKSTSLQTNSGKMIKLISRMNSIYDRFARIRYTIDWDVMGEAQLESKISYLLSDLNAISKRVNDAGITLQNIEKE